MKDCKSIQFGTHEWADENFNFINGCEHDCKYCYSKEMAIRFKRKTPDSWSDEEVRKGFLDKKFTKRPGTIMFPSSHDITPRHINQTIQVLTLLLQAGNHLLIVTKPHLSCIKRICQDLEEYKNQIIFRFTIGSSNSGILKFWEPGAPSFEERLESLQLAFSLGFQTSISAEPILDTEPELLVKKLLPFVTESLWLGKANFLLKRMKTNGVKDKNSFRKANDLILWQTDDMNILRLVNQFEKDPHIKWKESIKKVILRREMAIIY